jgi:hypothetical protein
MDYEQLKSMLTQVVPFNRHVGLEIKGDRPRSRGSDPA